jgi:A/G-specific adenine glycosylase
MNSELLTNWFLSNKRDLPWRKTKDPYAIWLSEVILQQTRIEQGIPYYLKFINKYPTVKDLANAEEEDVISLWKGLGYYSRARNLHFAAKQIVNNYSGIFPSGFEQIKNLKGVGEYTAAAIASIAFDEKVPVVDGNVKRVASRFFGIFNPIDKVKTAKQIFELLKIEIQSTPASDFNQAMMELGSLICKPQNPNCTECPLQSQCFAFNNSETKNLPVKGTKIKRKSRYFNYLMMEYDNKILVIKRNQEDIWKHLYEFYLIESEKLLSLEELIAELNLNKIDFAIKNVSNTIKHVLTHRDIYAQFLHLHFTQKPDFKGSWVHIDKLQDVSFPVLISKFVESYWNLNSYS